MGRKKQTCQRLHRVARLKPKTTGRNREPKRSPQLNSRRFAQKIKELRFRRNQVRAAGDYSTAAFHQQIDDTTHAKYIKKTYVLSSILTRLEEHEIETELSNLRKLHPKLYKKFTQQWNKEQRRHRIYRAITKNVSTDLGNQGLEKRWNPKTIKWELRPARSDGHA